MSMTSWHEGPRSRCHRPSPPFAGRRSARARCGLLGSSPRLLGSGPYDHSAAAMCIATRAALVTQDTTGRFRSRHSSPSPPSARSAACHRRVAGRRRRPWARPRCRGREQARIVPGSSRRGPRPGHADSSSWKSFLHRFELGHREDSAIRLRPSVALIRPSSTSCRTRLLPCPARARRGVARAGASIGSRASPVEDPAPFGPSRRQRARSRAARLRSPSQDSLPPEVDGTAAFGRTNWTPESQ